MQSPPTPPSFIYQQPAAVPLREDPAVEEARRRQVVTEEGLQGRGSTLLAGAAQPDPTQRAAGSRLLGNFGALG